MRRINEIVRAGSIGPSRAELIGYRTNHPALSRSLRLAYSLIPFPYKWEIAVLVEIDLLAISTFGEIVVLQCDGLFSLIAPPPYTLSLPNTLLVLPSACTCLICPDGPIFASGEGERTDVVRYPSWVTSSQRERLEGRGKLTEVKIGVVILYRSIRAQLWPASGGCGPTHSCTVGSPMKPG